MSGDIDLKNSIDEIRKEFGSLKEVFKGLNQPAPRFTEDAEGGSVSYFEESNEYVAFDLEKARAEREAGQKCKSLKLPKGYKHGVFKGFGDFLKSGYQSGGTGEWRSKVNNVYEKAIQGMGVQVGEDGGFLVMPEFASGILERVYSNNLFAQTDNYTVSGNTMTFNRNAETSRANGSRHGGLRGYWGAEGASMTSSSPKIRQTVLNLKKLHVLVYLTQELIDDAGTAIEQYVTRKAAEEFNFMLGDAVFNGTGVGQPLGILSAPALVSVAAEGGQSADTIVAANIDKMFARKIAGGNYTWYHNQDCGPQLDQLTQDVGTGGVTLYRPANGIAGAAAQTLKGLPRVETEFNPTLGDQGDLILADLSKVLSISKGGISQQASMHVAFLTDQMAIKFTMRCDARPWEDTPLTPYKGSATQSAFVALDAR
jgi:HK97 family phage major capsid protein